MMNEKISIIIPIYKVEDCLLNCLKSCIEQSYENIEILVVVNGIKNLEIKSAISKMMPQDDRLKLFYTDRKGVSHARNIGIENASGEWITFVDADDKIDRDFCKIMLESAKQYRSEVVICSFNKSYSKHLELIKITNQTQIIDSNEFLQNILNIKKNQGLVWGKIWNSRVIKENNIHFNENLTLAEDADFCIKSTHFLNKILLIEDALYTYNISDNSAVRSFNDRYAEEFEKSMISIKQYLENKSCLNYTYQFDNFCTFHLLLIVVNYCFNPANKMKYREQKELLNDVLKKSVFKNSLYNCKLDNFSIEKKITVILLKLKLYYFVSVIAKIRITMR